MHSRSSINRGRIFVGQKQGLHKVAQQPSRSSAPESGQKPSAPSREANYTSKRPDPSSPNNGGTEKEPSPTGKRGPISEPQSSRARSPRKTFSLRAPPLAQEAHQPLPQRLRNGFRLQALISIQPHVNRHHLAPCHHLKSLNALGGTPHFF